MSFTIRGILLLCMVAWGLLTVPAYSAQTLSITDAPQITPMADYLHVLEDPNAEYGRENLTDPIFNARFEPLYRGAANYGFSGSVWWVRFSVINTDLNPQKTTFMLDYPLLDYVDVWVLSGGEERQAWSTGNRRKFNTRPVDHRGFLFPLTLAAGERQTVYLRVKTEGPVNIGLTLFSAQSLLPKISQEYMTFGAYFGSFLLLALCIAVLYLKGREPVYFYYFAYILSYGCYLLAFNGLAFQYLWPEMPAIGQGSRPVLLTLAMVFLLQFSRALLEIRTVWPLMSKIVTILQTILLGLLLLVPVVGYGPMLLPFAVLLLFAMIAVLAMGIVALQEKVPTAGYYLAAWSFFLIGMLAYLLKIFGLLPHTFFTHYGFQIGSFFELILLSAALGMRDRSHRERA